MVIRIPAYKMPYVAAPKNGDTGPLAVKAIVLEEITNVNGWRVVPEQFERVAAQYKQGRQLRLNHSKDVQEIIGKSFDSKVLLGKDVSAYMGKEIEGINANSKYVVTEFEADPQDAQVRTNILRGYVDTGSIGLDAEAYCDECSKELKSEGDEMIRTCRHLDAGVKLDKVDVKEYSYVSEPAYPHSFVLPTFSAAFSNLPKPKIAPEESSLSQSAAKQPVEMSASSKVELKAKKADAEGDAEGDGDSDSDDMIPQKYADAIMAAYKKGLSDSRKFRADGDGESDSDSKKGDADASANAKSDAKSASAAAAKTDQITRVESDAKPTPKDDFMDRILRPTSIGLDPALRELFKAAAESPTTPNDIRSKFKGRFG